MSPTLIGIIGFAIFFALMATGLPIGITLIVVGFGGLVYLMGWDPAMATFSFTPYSIVSNYDFAVIPLFLFMAAIINKAGFGKELYNAAARWIGFMPGGLAMATVSGGAVYGAMCADSLAGTLAMTYVSLPEMDRFKYKRSLSVGSICVAGPLSILIPPSNVMIIYGILTQTSIGKLFIAGIIPGVIAAVLYMSAIYLMCKRDPSMGPAGPKYSFKEMLLSLTKCWEIVLIVGLMLGGLFTGWFTPIEAGGVGAFGSLFVSIARRRLNWNAFKESVMDTMKVTGLLYIVVIGAFIFMPFVALTQLPASLANFAVSLPVPPLLIVFAIIIVYLILGCFLESMSMMLITIPIFFPVLLELGFSSIWFGILIVRVIEIGLLTPPVGLNLYTVASVTKTPLKEAIKGIVPFLLMDVVSISIMMFFPIIVEYLPGIM